MLGDARGGEAGPDLDALANSVLAGDRVALAKAITLVESTRETDHARAAFLIRKCLPHTGHSLRLGITGIPGVGKSTFIDAAGKVWLDRGHRVAVLAVDPSSSRSGGSILGDKTRMHHLANAPGAFIRPTPTGGTLGGLARRTRETVLLCEAAGYDRILVETVGVGQNELDIRMVTDLTLLLAIAGAGDELQGIKRGIMEVADAVAVNKADATGTALLRSTKLDLEHGLAMLPARDGRRPRVLTCSAATSQGIPALIDHLEELAMQDRNTGVLHARREQQTMHWARTLVNEALERALWSDDTLKGALPHMIADVAAGRCDADEAAGILLRRLRTGGAPLHGS